MVRWLHPCLRLHCSSYRGHSQCRANTTLDRVQRVVVRLYICLWKGLNGVFDQEVMGVRSIITWFMRCVVAPAPEQLFLPLFRRKV